MEHDRLHQVQEKANQVSTQASQSIQLALERNIKLGDVVEKANKLHEASIEFEIVASKTKRHFWRKNFKLTCIIATIVVAILLIIIGISVGLTKKN